MMKYLKYFQYVFAHKWYVFLACLKYGLVWQGIIHDASKFLPSEFIPYANHFNGDIQRGRDKTGYYKPVNTGDTAFDYAWLLHQHRNPHHWQYWVLVNDEDGTYPMKIPDRYVKEMFCDWIGAGRAQKTTGVSTWYAKNKDKMILHLETRKWLEQEIYK